LIPDEVVHLGQDDSDRRPAISRAGCAGSSRAGARRMSAAAATPCSTAPWPTPWPPPTSPTRPGPSPRLL